MTAGWTEVPLGAVATIRQDPVEPHRVAPDTPYVGLEHIGRDGAGLRPVATGSAGLESFKYRFTERQVLFGKLRPYLAKVARPRFAGICSTDILPIEPGDRLDRDYLAHYLLQPAMVARATSRSTGANLPRLAPRELATFPVLLPPLAEQRRIAAVLDRADTVRAARRTSLTQLDELVRAVFHESFGSPGGNPHGWPVRRLGGMLARGPQNGLYKPASAYGSGTPIVRIDAFYDGVITGLGRLRRLAVTGEEIQRYGLSAGDLLINRVNSPEYLGKAALVPELAEPTVFESNMMRLAVDPAVLHPVFLGQMLRTAHVKAQIRVAAKDAVNQSSINQGDVRALAVPVPPIEAQERFAAVVRAVERQAAAHRRHLSEVEELFEALRGRAFRGGLPGGWVHDLGRGPVENLRGRPGGDPGAPGE